MSRIVAVGAFLLCCELACGQALPVVPPTFEAVSIHPHPSPHVIATPSFSGPRCTLQGYTQALLIQEAYDLKGYQVQWAGKPQDSMYYDIIAKVDGDDPPDRAVFHHMLQALLAQRFNLHFHMETKLLPVYALTVGKGGPKFEQSAPDAAEHGYMGVHGRNQTIEAPRESMAALADQIQGSFAVDRPIIDRTGLPGYFNIRFEATPEFRAARSSEAGDLNVFTAVQEQLGLKLEPTKAEFPVLVIDHVEPPSEN